MRTTLCTWAGAIAFAALFLALGAPDQMDASPAVTDAQQQARQERRYELAAAAINETEMKAARRCNEAHPGGAALVWSSRGEAVCVPRPLP
ncbi:MAG: hypothetical protein V4757_07390 [Pseudomonadota bacterium]